MLTVMFSRGGFLKICGAALLRPQLDACAWLALPQGGFHLQNAKPSDFAPHIGSTFAARSAEGADVQLVLAALDAPSSDGHTEQFSLTFHASADAGLPEGTYAIEHAGIGRFDLFIAPVGALQPRPAVYEACFSRTLNAG